MRALGELKGRPVAFLATAAGAVLLLVCGLFRKEISEVLVNGALL